MDDIDKQLLKHLEKNSRVSLKKLALELNVKISTLYHRFHKLSESKKIEQYSVIINPKSLDVKFFYLITLKPKFIPDQDKENVFLTSFATFISEQFEEIFFSGLSDDLELHILVSFFSEKHRSEFIQMLDENPYFTEKSMIQLTTIPKGLKMWNFNSEYLMQQLKKEQRKPEISTSMRSGSDAVKFHE